MKPKIKTETSEVNAMKTPTGVLILQGICNQAGVVSTLADSLSQFGSPYYSYRYGNDHDGDEIPTTEVPEAVTEMVGAMKDSAKNLLRMVNSFARAESSSGDEMLDDPTNDDNDADDVAAMGQESKIISESATGEIVMTFTESGSAQVIKGEITGTMIVAGLNANKNRFYTEESLQNAVSRKLWEGKRMYVDHMTEAQRKEGRERSPADMVAVIRETRYDASTKSIKYRATLADPIWESKLAYMQERGILSGMGVSIHASASGRKEVIESAPTLVIEQFVEAYSTDFVTSPGAGGSIDLLESDPSGKGKPAETGETPMNEKEIAALMESFKGIVTAAVAPIAEAQTALSTRLETVETQGKIGTMIESTTLPDAAKAQLTAQFAKATTLDGVAEAITGMTTLCEALAPAKAAGTEVVEGGVRKVGKPSPVHGLGTQVENVAAVEGKTATIADFVASPAIALLGGKDKGAKLLESFR